MVAGYDKYFQVARCFRDEDLRADRQPEFTQIDLEMSFVEEADVMQVVERFVSKAFTAALGIPFPGPVPRMCYDEAMGRFGSDAPDTRYGMELVDRFGDRENVRLSRFSPGRSLPAARSARFRFPAARLSPARTPTI